LAVCDVRDEVRKERVARDKVCLAVELNERGAHAAAARCPSLSRVLREDRHADEALAGGAVRDF